MSTLTAFSEQLANAVARASGATVSVHARPKLPSTGVHWKDGVVVTTEATVQRDNDITLTLPDGNRVPATLAGRDPGSDLAALRIDKGLLPVAERGDAAALRAGHLVLALARLGDGGPRAAFGAVSATGGRWRSWKGGELDLRLQSDVRLYPGFGGGPLVDATGLVLGINSGGLSGPLATTIPGTTVDRIVEQLLQRGSVARGWLGAAMQPVRGGVVLLSIEPDAPAALAGLLVGDVVVGIAGRPVDSLEPLLAFLAGDVVGKHITLDLLRGGVRTKTDVLIGERPRRTR
jgi:S1-C subfamily serine protease